MIKPVLLVAALISNSVGKELSISTNTQCGEREFEFDFEADWMRII